MYLLLCSCICLGESCLPFLPGGHSRPSHAHGRCPRSQMGQRSRACDRSNDVCWSSSSTASSECSRAREISAETAAVRAESRRKPLVFTQRRAGASTTMHSNLFVAVKLSNFLPRIVLAFLYFNLQAVAVPLTNFAGRPFALDVASSLPLLAATVGGVVVILALAAGVVPPLEALLQWDPLLEQRPFSSSSSSLAEGQPIVGGNPQAAQRTALALGTLILPWVRRWYML